MAVVDVEFSMCQYNSAPDGDEVIFPYNGKWYRIKAEDMPSEYFKYRMLKLWLDNGQCFDIVLDVDLSKPCTIKVDLDKAEEIPESYPLG